MIRSASCFLVEQHLTQLEPVTRRIAECCDANDARDLLNVAFELDAFLTELFSRLVHVVDAKDDGRTTRRVLGIALGDADRGRALGGAKLSPPLHLVRLVEPEHLTLKLLGCIEVINLIPGYAKFHLSSSVIIKIFSDVLVVSRVLFRQLPENNLASG